MTRIISKDKKGVPLYKYNKPIPCLQGVYLYVQGAILFKQEYFSNPDKFPPKNKEIQNINPESLKVSFMLPCNGREPLSARADGFLLRRKSRLRAVPVRRQ